MSAERLLSEPLLQRLLRQLQAEGWQAPVLRPKGPQHWQLQALVKGQAQCFELYLNAQSWTLSQQGYQLQVPLPQQPQPAGSTTTASCWPERAPMAARLLGWGPDVCAGAELPGGSLLYRLEAMKMQLTVTAPAPLRVRALLASPGQDLRPGQEILDLMPLEETP
ncbi:MAG: acetyl-CoA carboxylase biotin carboxyl carrier protein subunit [Candidatus Sericytochromatia bacterium]|nr:acetyl-CoA carboxylase biotin carboxyl carrier protein subunit [Candidatus Sericytochromatia bacterium]